MHERSVGDRGERKHLQGDDGQLARVYGLYEGEIEDVRATPHLVRSVSGFSRDRPPGRS